MGQIHVSERGLVAIETGRLLLSPSKYLSWGFPDRSIRIGIIDSDKVGRAKQKTLYFYYVLFSYKSNYEILGGSTANLQFTISWNTIAFDE